MKAMVGYAALVCAVCFTGAAAAEDKKPAKPTVCLRYSIAKTASADDDAVGICYDNAKEGRKPTLYYRFEEVTIVGQTTGRIKVLVGWR